MRTDYFYLRNLRYQREKNYPADKEDFADVFFDGGISVTAASNNVPQVKKISQMLLDKKIVVS